MIIERRCLTADKEQRFMTFGKSHVLWQEGLNI